MHEKLWDGRHTIYSGFLASSWSNRQGPGPRSHNWQRLDWPNMLKFEMIVPFSPRAAGETEAFQTHILAQFSNHTS